MKSVALELLKQPTARDRQVLAGPSSLGSGCDACVAYALSNPEREENYYWLGAVIGTAVHLLLEEREKTTPGGSAALLEHKVVVGEVPGYGVIKGSIDRYETRTRRVVDYKTTLKKHVPSLKKAYENPEPVEGEPLTWKEARLKLRGYVGQLHLYGLALTRAGKKPKTLVLEFICRDGSSDEDIFPFEFDYDLEYAELLWGRVLYIHENLNNPKVKFASDPHCQSCALR